MEKDRISRDIKIWTKYEEEMNKMKIKSKVSKMSGKRKHVELPLSVRDNYELGEEVTIEKVKNKIGGKQR